MKEIEFFPMSHRPPYSKDDPEYSEVVLVFDNEINHSDFGFFKFSDESWNVLGDDSLKLICWCFIPDPSEFLKDRSWESIKHFGYRD